MLGRLFGREDSAFIARQHLQLVHIGIKPEVNDKAYNAFLELGAWTFKGEESTR